MLSLSLVLIIIISVNIYTPMSSSTLIPIHTIIILPYHHRDCYLLIIHIKLSCCHHFSCHNHLITGPCQVYQFHHHTSTFLLSFLIVIITFPNYPHILVGIVTCHCHHLKCVAIVTCHHHFFSLPSYSCCYLHSSLSSSSSHFYFYYRHLSSLSSPFLISTYSCRYCH